MKKFFEKKLKVYAHEFPQFIWISSIFFGIFFVTAIFRNYVDTAFLKRYGPDNIPMMLVINGLLTFVVFGLSNRLSRRYLDHTLMSGFMGIYGVATGLLFLGAKAGQVFVYPVLFQMLYLLDSLLLVYLWNIAGDLFDARQGKRLFALITASQVLGTTLGNFATKPLAGLIGDDQTLLVFGAAALLSAGFLAHTGRRMLGDKAPKPGASSKAPSKSLLEVPGLIKEYPMIRFLIVLGLVPSLLMPIFTYQFSVIVNNTFASEEALMSFLSVFRGAITMITFILLMLTGRLYSKMGLVNASLVHPLNFAILFSALTFFFNIYVAAYGQFTVRLIQRAIAGPVNKILFNVIPTDLAAWARIFIRGTVVKVGMMAGALLMIALKPLISAQLLAPIAAALAIYWVIETLFFGRLYKWSLKQVIVEKRVDFDQIDSVRPFECDGGSIEIGHVKVDEHKDEVLPEVACPTIPPETALKLLEDANPMVRAEAAASFALSIDPRAVKKLIRCLGDNEVVRKGAIEALVSYGAEILPYLESSLQGADVRVQRGILEVMRLAGFKEFEVTPFIGDRLCQAYNNLIALRRLEQLDRLTSVAMLGNHLKQKNEELVSLVFQALWVHYPDMRLMYEALASETSSVAVEMVEASIQRGMVPYLIPLIEGIPVDEKIDHGRKIFPLMRGEKLERILTLLAHDEDSITRMLALFTIGEANPRAAYLPTIEDLENDRQPYVREVAQYALKRCYNEESAMPDTVDRINKLSGFSIFQGMGIRELQAISSVATIETYKPGDVIIKEKEENYSIYLIVKGKVAIYDSYGAPEQSQKALIGAGDFVGELSLFTELPPKATCVAAEESEAFVIRHQQFHEIIKIYPQIGINLCRFFSQKLREIQY